MGFRWHNTISPSFNLGRQTVLIFLKALISVCIFPQLENLLSSTRSTLRSLPKFANSLRRKSLEPPQRRYSLSITPGVTPLLPLPSLLP